MGVIYRILSLATKKEYIGSSVDYKRRRYKHFTELKAQKHPNTYLQRHFNKYGKKDLIFSIIEIVDNNTDILLREQFYIDTIKPSFNMCAKAGNCLGRKHTEDAKKKMADAQNRVTRDRSHSAETKRKISQSNKNKIRTEEQRKNISMGQMGLKKGIKLSEETKRKIGLSSLGHTLSDSAKKKISDKVKAWHQRNREINECVPGFGWKYKGNKNTTL